MQMDEESSSGGKLPLAADAVAASVAATVVTPVVTIMDRFVVIKLQQHCDYNTSQNCSGEVLSQEALFRICSVTSERCNQKTKTLRHL
ncbi:uncharacterized protein AKAW2_61097A [Aspergillus luchuensis]|uniref:Uncharacterized protein n=1 Tax=Aspergillus kawachii TaxID=1069201 RepID=A0A146EXN0_ASPKA|nr:uncharacterized protein AKAW2_61097A [Aspergillus luchuensis]BCS02833.1 hypothetical protein AKAW2_61097A [Aspergillus luchuensis]BCS14485.1 hypothetical protein ALUC_61041A [Aspergillus luchuensis]GAT18824.1 hypothetical protein RIB2604_00103230 [Aspergillus luchuensis]